MPEVIDGFRFNSGQGHISLVSLGKTPDIKVNLYSPSYSAGEGEGEAALWVGAISYHRNTSKDSF